VADRRHREIACAVRDFEIGEDGAGEAAILVVIAQCALGFAGGAAGVVQGREIVGARKIARAGVAGLLDHGQEIGAVGRGPQGEDGLEDLRSCRKIAAAIAEGGRIDHQHLGLGILELEQLVVQRAERMQIGEREPRELRGDAGAPAVGAVGGDEGYARAGREVEPHEHRLHPSDQVGRTLVGQRAARPRKCSALRIARQCPQRLHARGREGVERVHWCFSLSAVI